MFHWTLSDTAFLESPAGGEVRAWLGRNLRKYRETLTLQTRLRTLWPSVEPHHLQASLETALLDVRLREKCGFPPDCLATAEALEQASSAAAARLHASFLPRHGQVLEVGAGIGADTLALSARASQVTAIEADPVRATMLRHNLAKAGRTNVRILTGAVETWASSLSQIAWDAVYADPARRRDGVRHKGPEHYAPSLSVLLSLAREHPLVVKAGPADTISDSAFRRCFVAVGTECREQLLFSAIDQMEGTVFDADSDAVWRPQPDRYPSPVCGDPRFLVEPHPAIVRSHPGAYFREIGAAPIDPRIGYGLLTTPPPASRWHRTFRILHDIPFDRRRIQALISELGWGPGTEIKKRGFPRVPEEIRKELKWKGTRSGVLICTRRGDRHYALLCERWDG